MHFLTLEHSVLMHNCVTMRNASAECTARTIFGQVLPPAGITHKFIMPAGGEGIITACFAQNLVCIRPVAC